MPGFGDHEALSIVQAHDPLLPFVYVAGTVGEEVAIEAIRRGAADFVLKENLRRLPSVVGRALESARERRERLRIEAALRESEERFRSIVENSHDWIWEIDRDARLTYCNAAVERMLGHAPERLLGQDCLQLPHPHDRTEVARRLPALIEHGGGWRGWRLHWLHRDGSVRVVESTGEALRDAQGRVRGFRGVNHDITELLQKKDRIQHLARLHGVLSALGNAVLRAGTRQEVLDAACRVAVEQGGFLAACIGEPGAGGQDVRLSAWYGDAAAIAAVAEIGRRGQADPVRPSPGTRALQRNEWTVAADLASAAEGVPDWAAAMAREAGIAAQLVVPAGDPPWCALGLFAATPQAFDEEERALYKRLADEIDYAADFIAKSERLEYLAYFDPLTGLPNRASLQAHLQTRLERERVALAVLDLERFGAINESRGRAFGDRLLAAVGEHLRRLIEGHAMLARLEADSFALAWPAEGDADHELARMEALLQQLNRTPLALDGDPMRVRLNGGLAIGPDHGADPETLEHAAVAALAEARKRRVRAMAFGAELRGRAAQRLQLEEELRRAVERGEFELHDQPKVAAETHRLVGAEALLRWRHPERGRVGPAEFMAVLEDSGLIVPVGRWALREALRTALAWREHWPGLRLAVNVSARELQHAGFLEHCSGLLAPFAGESPPLDIEVTESLFMEDINQTIALLEEVRALGCRVAIDDFGTGYSSLNYVARLPADELKIDLSFTRLMTQSPETLALVTHIINLAHSLGLRVVAEGVEDEEQAKLLRLLRCDVLQGFLLGPPLPASEFARRLLGLDEA